MSNLTQERLKEKLRYDPDTGLFYHMQNYGPVARGSVAGWCSRAGYTYIRVDQQDYLAHRLAWFYVTGKWPDALIDHANLDKADNRFCNLREATKSQNGANGQKRAHNTSGIRGVSFHKRAKKWVASICIHGEQKHLGLFPTKESAAAAYRSASVTFFGEFAPC